MSRQTNHRRRERNRTGSVMPFVAVSIVFFLSMLGVAVDMMNDFQAVNQLEYAAQTAAFYGLSLLTDTDSTYQMTSAQQRTQNAIMNNTALWNVAPSGPTNKQATVPFAATDVTFVPNPAEATGPNQEYFLQVTGRRSGQSSLTAFFLPLLYVGFSQPTVPAGVSTISPFRMVEVIGQPASRIGPGAPLNSQANTRAADLVGFATFPLALNYAQFQQHAQGGQTSNLTIDLVTKFGGTAQANHIQGSFVDVSPNPGSVTGFGSAGSAATLQNLLQYFSGNIAQNLPPASVERGDQLASYSLQTLSQTQVLNAVKTTLTLKNGFAFYLPVLQGNQVVGFARGTLVYTALATGTPPFALTLNLASSLPCRNASSATGYTANPSQPGVLLPPPPTGSPFMPRTLNLNTNIVSARPTGVVLAPSLSPRALPPPPPPSPTGH